MRGVLALVVGNAISIPIFVLPGPLAGLAGPSVVLAAALAAVPAAFLVVFNAQLGSAVPVAGGLYVYLSRLTAPFWGFLVPWSLPVVTWASVLFTAAGFAEYVRFFVDLPTVPLMYALVVGVLVVNLVGIRLVAQLQVALVVLLLASILAFVVGGLPHVDPGNYTPLFPEGAAATGVAVVALYYPYLGFGLLTELGEEIDDPGRTIPLALLAGVGVVALVYVAIVGVLVGVTPWQRLGGMEAAVAQSAGGFLPGPVAALVALGAVFAVATTVNTSFLVSSRTIMRAGRDGILPAALSRVHPRLGTPHVSILLLGVPPLFFVPFEPEIIHLSVFIALTVLTAAFFSGIAVWNLPAAFPEHYENAVLQLSRGRGLLLAVLAGCGVSAALWLVTLARLPSAGLLLFGWFAAGYVYYRYRVRSLEPPREEVYLAMTTLHDHEDAFPERGTYDYDGDPAGDDAD